MLLSVFHVYLKLPSSQIGPPYPGRQSQTLGFWHFPWFLQSGRHIALEIQKNMKLVYWSVSAKLNVKITYQLLQSNKMLCIVHKITSSLYHLLTDEIRLWWTFPYFLLSCTNWTYGTQPQYGHVAQTMYLQGRHGGIAVEQLPYFARDPGSILILVLPV